MKYIKKVSVSDLVSNTGTIIDSMNPGDDQTVNAPSIHAVKDYCNNLFSTVLYSNSSGTEGTVTLAETSANFSYLEIYYLNKDDLTSNLIKISSPDGKKFNINEVIYNTNDSDYYLSSKIYSVSGTNISVYQTQRITYIHYDINGDFVSVEHVIQYEGFKIYKVVGYK